MNVSFWERVGMWIVAVAAIVQGTDFALKNAPTLRDHLLVLQPFFAYSPLLLVVIAGGIFLAVKLGWLKRYADSAQLVLRFNQAGQSVPDKLSHHNIWRWYILHSVATFVAPQGSYRATTATIVVSFEPEVSITTIRCASPDSVVPKYEVKEFNQRYAIIVFETELPKGTLQINFGL